MIYILAPHQLYGPKHFEGKCTIFLTEEYLFFEQYNFHKTKICYHRATMNLFVDEMTQL